MTIKPTGNGGIYEIANRVNGKRYIGSAAYFNKRWSQHRHQLRRGTHHCAHLQRAWTKYGESEFVFRVLCGSDLAKDKQHGVAKMMTMSTILARESADPLVIGPSRTLPHPIPYQGSKRVLAGRILATVVGQHFQRLFEPFAGSSAISLAAANANLADRYIISDALSPLIDIWSDIIARPTVLADRYEKLWHEQRENPRHYLEVRARFNSTGGSAELLYLFARCVKNAPRFNRDGGFNQSADLRRKGMHPAKMRHEITGAAALLRDRAVVHAADYHAALAEAETTDLVYLDPPYQGTTVGADRRYYQQVERERLLTTLHDLNDRGIPFLLSYDGHHGDKTYGDPLPNSLELERHEIVAGRSSQATLNGRNVITIESLYVSPALRSLQRRVHAVASHLPLFQVSTAEVP
jgi:DNA adenine methylase